MKSNISKRMSQIIIPLRGLREGEGPALPEDTEPGAEFRSTVRDLQAKARLDLLQAREGADTRMVDIINTRRKHHSSKVFHLLGIPIDSKVRFSI